MNGIIEIIKPCTCENCGVNCCGENMLDVIPNTVEASIEKHKPVVEICENYINVSVNHVMDPDHYIEWIAFESNQTIGKKFFKPGESIKAVFPYVKNSTVYAYCNKHGLWSEKVK